MLRLLIEGRWFSAMKSGRSLGEWAGVTIGVWSGVGERESCENVGEGGAVENGLFGRLFFVGLWRYGSSASCECDRDMGCAEMEYCARLAPDCLAAVKALEIGGKRFAEVKPCSPSSCEAAVDKMFILSPCLDGPIGLCVPLLVEPL